jgi:hypothetical protein
MPTANTMSLLKPINNSGNIFVNVFRNVLTLQRHLICSPATHVLGGYNFAIWVHR